MAFLSNIQPIPDFNSSDGDISYDNESGELKYKVGDDYLTLSTSTASNWGTTVDSTADASAPTYSVGGTLNINGTAQTVGYVADYNYTTYTYPAEGDILTYNDNTVKWEPANWIINKFTLFSNDFIYIDEKGDVYIDNKIETNPSKIGMAILRAIETLNDKVVDSIDDL